MNSRHRAALAVLASMAAFGAAQPAQAQFFPGDCMISGGGQIVASSGDRATFGGSAASTRLHAGTQVYIDHGPATDLRFRSLTTTAIVCMLDARRAEIVGTGVVTTDDGGDQVVQYRIAVFDPGQGSTLPDFYRITLSNGYDSGEQPVVHGQVNIRAR